MRHTTEIVQPSTKSLMSSVRSPERIAEITKRIGATAGAMGATVTPEGLKVMAIDLCHLSDRAIDCALAKCRREAKSVNGFAPKLIIGDILASAGLVLGEEAESMEAVAAWDQAIEIARKYARASGGGMELRRFVHPPLADCEACSGSGMVVRAHGSSNVASPCPCKVIEEVPELEKRLVDAVTRQGGWVKFKDVPTDAFFFRRRDFLAEYQRWSKVENQASNFRRIGASSTLGPARHLLISLIPDTGSVKSPETGIVSGSKPGIERP